MTNSTLASLSDELVNRVASVAPAVVQVDGGRRPVSGIVHGTNTILTTARSLGREDGLRVRLADGSVMAAELAGWDPSNGVAVLRTDPALGPEVPGLMENEVRTGEIVLALARSWSNAVTAATGTVAVIGGPLRTGRRRQIARVIRITAPMHEGFAGGGVFDAQGLLMGMAIAAEIRGFGVVIPAAIAWASAAQVLTSGTPRRPFLGIAVQGVHLPASQRPEGRERALLVVGITASSPAETAGLNVGDVVLDVDGKPTTSPDDLFELLGNREVGQSVSARVLRAGTIRDVQLTIAERPTR